MLDDGLPTTTSVTQVELERRVLQIYEKAYGEGARSGQGQGQGAPAAAAAAHPTAAAAAALVRCCPAGGFDPADPDLVLNREQHAKYLGAGLGQLSSGGRAGRSSAGITGAERMAGAAHPSLTFLNQWIALQTVQASSPWTPPAPGLSTGSRTGGAHVGRMRACSEPLPASRPKQLAC